MALSAPVPIAVFEMEKSHFRHWQEWYSYEGEKRAHKRWSQLLDYPGRSSPIVHPSGGRVSSAFVEFVIKLVYWLDARSKHWVSPRVTGEEGMMVGDVLEDKVVLFRCKRILKRLLERGSAEEHFLRGLGGRGIRNMQLHDSGNPTVHNELLKLCNLVGARPIRGQMSEPELDSDSYFAVAFVLPKEAKSGHLELEVTPLQSRGTSLDLVGERLEDFPVVLCGCSHKPSGRFGDSNFLDSNFKWMISTSFAGGPSAKTLKGVSNTDRLKLLFVE